MTLIERPAVVKIENLSAFVQEQVDNVNAMLTEEGMATDESYAACVVAMVETAYVTIEAVAKALGVSGFQYSVAGMQLLAQMRNLDGPFMLVDLEQALYPQYDLLQKVEKFISSDETKRWLADEAQKRLDKHVREDGGLLRAAPAVVEHWKNLVADRPV